MNSIDFKTLIKVALVCIVLIAVGPFVLGFFGVIIKGVMFIVLFIILAIIVAVMLFKLKINKINKKMSNNEANDVHTYSEDSNDTIKDNIDYSDSTIIDVDEYKEDK